MCVKEKTPYKEEKELGAGEWQVELGTAKCKKWEHFKSGVRQTKDSMLSLRHDYIEKVLAFVVDVHELMSCNNAFSPFKFTQLQNSDIQCREAFSDPDVHTDY